MKRLVKYGKSLGNKVNKLLFNSLIIIIDFKKDTKIFFKCQSKGLMYVEYKIKQLHDEETIQKIAAAKGLSLKNMRALLFAAKIYLRLQKMRPRFCTYKWCENSFSTMLHPKSKDDFLYKKLLKNEHQRLKREYNNIIMHIDVMVHKPSFTVIIDADKSKNRLSNTLKSIMAQIYTNCEICILCDNNKIKSLLKNEPVKFISSIKEVSGDFIVFMEAGQMLANNALYEFANAINQYPSFDMMYGDEDMINDKEERANPFYKPKWSPDYLETFNYIGFTSCFRTKVAIACGEYLNLYDFILKFTEKTINIHHIKKILGYKHKISLCSKLTKHDIKSLQERLLRTGRIGIVRVDEKYRGCYDIQLNLKQTPLVSVIIATAGKTVIAKRREVKLITNIINQIRNKSSYKNIQIIVVNNGDLPETQTQMLMDYDCQLITYDEQVFNIAKKLNLGASIAKGELLLFMNDNIEVTSTDWIERMVEHFEKDYVGVVGGKHLCRNGKIQDVGIVHNAGNPEHVRHFCLGDESGYFFSTCGVRNYVAINGAAIMTRANLYRELGGYTEDGATSYNDIDYCLKVSKQGFHIVYAPKAKFVNIEDKSHIKDATPEEVTWYQDKWASDIVSDEYYNEEVFTVNPPTFELDINKRMI